MITLMNFSSPVQFSLLKIFSFFQLTGVNVGRGRGSYDEIERRSLTVTTNSVTVYHSSEKEYRQLEEKEWGHFYSAESKHEAA